MYKYYTIPSNIINFLYSCASNIFM